MRKAASGSIKRRGDHRPAQRELHDPAQRRRPASTRRQHRRPLRYPVQPVELIQPV